VRSPGNGEVLIRLAASPVNPSDLHFLEGEYAFRRRLPVAAIGLIERVKALHATSFISAAAASALGQMLLPLGRTRGLDVIHPDVSVAAGNRHGPCRRAWSNPTQSRRRLGGAPLAGRLELRWWHGPLVH
jgi:hypothetical protein